MKLSFLAAGSYEGSVPNRSTWPVPPEACDPLVASRSLTQNLELARHADALGFDWISVSEHHYAPLMLTPNPLVWAGALTQVVRRARIALLGPILPLNNPVRVAEEVAMLDAMSEGRIVVLFLRGIPAEWRTYAADVGDARAATQEGIDLILKAWTSPQPFAWASPHLRYDTVSVWPRPLQRPHPPVFGSGNSEESVIFAARRRLGLAISFAPPAQIAKSVLLYRAEAEKAGWTPTTDHVLYRAIASVADSDAAAEDSSATTPSIFAPFFHGGPKRILGQIETLRDAGVGIIDMAFGGGGHARAVASLELLAREVLPKMRTMSPARN